MSLKPIKPLTELGQKLGGAFGKNMLMNRFLKKCHTKSLKKKDKEKERQIVFFKDCPARSKKKDRKVWKYASIST